MNATAATPRVASSAQLLRRLEDVEAIASEWEALAEACGAGPFARPAYALTWWRHLGHGRLLVATVREGGRLVVLVPLHERSATPYQVARWLGHGLGTVGDVLVEPGSESALNVAWAALARRRRVLELVECRDGLGVASLAAFSRGVRRTTVSSRDHCPVIPLSGDGLSHLALPGARNLRSTLSRADRALSTESVSFVIEVVEDAGRFGQILPELRQILDAAEAERPRLNLLRPPYEGFSIGYLREVLAHGRAAVLLGRVDGSPVAFKVVLLDGSTASIWLMRFLPEAARFRPGHLLFREAYRWAAGRGLTTVDLLLGVSQTKNQWSSGTYPTVDAVHGGPLAIRWTRLLTRLAGWRRGKAW